MKAKITSFISVGFVLVSCTKEPKACIDGPLTVSEGETPTYTWCGSNAKTIEWNMNGQSGSGNSFTPQFSFRGKNTVEVNGVNGNKERRTTIDVEYGKTSNTQCIITNQCSTGSQNLYSGPTLAYYWGYLYNSKTNWVTDVTNGNHLLCIDSVSCEFSSQYNTGMALFKKTYPTGSGKLVSVEYRNPSDPTSLLSNWGDLFYSSSGSLNITNTEFNDNGVATRIGDNSKQFLKGKWILTQSFINNAYVPLPNCNKDDYLKFYADGTWMYSVGPDNCGGSSLPSNGTFANLPICGQSFTFIITTLQGPFTGQYCTYSVSSLQVNFTSGANTGYFIFDYQP